MKTFLSVIISWLERGFLVKTFDDEDKINIQEVRKLLSESSEDIGA